MLVFFSRLGLFYLNLLCHPLYVQKQASLPSAKEEYCQNPHRSHFKIQWLQWKVNSRSWTGIQKRNQTSGTEEGLLFPNIHRGFNGRRIRVLVKEVNLLVLLVWFLLPLSVFLRCFLRSLRGRSFAQLLSLISVCCKHINCFKGTLM